jgi:hypothetical protein
MQMADPEVTLTAGVVRLRLVADPEKRGLRLPVFGALLRAEELVRMVERLLADEDLCSSTRGAPIVAMKS